ncbi:MAG: hypothetical protein ABI968_05355 [Acidobacteriota bacterium]
MRTAPTVRLALCLAALLAVGGSFGLHPEPAAGLESAVQAAAFAKFHAPAGDHGCVACLTHGAALASPFSGILLASSPCEPASLTLDPLSHGRLACRDLPGRSPPLDRS